MGSIFCSILTLMGAAVLTPAVPSQGFFYNRYDPPAESKGGPGTETGPNKDQQVRTHQQLLHLPISQPLKQAFDLCDHACFLCHELPC